MQQEPTGTNWGFIGKCVGGMFATIVAPLLVAMMSQRLSPPAPVVQPAVTVIAPAPLTTGPAAPAAAPKAVATASAPAAATVPTTIPAQTDTSAPRLQRKAAPAAEPTKLASNVPVRTEAPTKLASSAPNRAESPKPASTPSKSDTPARKRTLDQAFPKAKFVSLFDGKTLGGWNADGVKHWSVVAGAITGRLGPNAADARDFLYTTANYRNFVLTARFKCSSGDAGILFRGKPNSLIAMQVFIGEVKPGCLCTMTDDTPRNHDQKFQTIAEASEKLIIQDAWNEIAIAANGDRIRCDINDQPAFDTQYASGPHMGVISFKLKPGTEVAFKDIRVARLGAD